jgi:hypothetical protein
LGLLLTASSYAIAFEYQAGYLSHFGLPADFVEVGARNLIIAAATVLGSAMLFYVFVAGLLDALPKSVRGWSPVVRRRVFFLGFLCVFLYFVSTRMHVTTVALLIGVGLPALMLIGELLTPLFIYRQIPSYAGKLEASVKADIAKQRSSDDLTQAIVRLLTPSIAAVLVVSVAACFFAYSVGESEAHSQKVFLVADAEKPCVVIRILSEGLLCVGFDPKTHIARGEYRLLRPDSVHMVLTETGSLGEAEALPVTGKATGLGGRAYWQAPAN